MISSLPNAYWLTAMSITRLPALRGMAMVIGLLPVDGSFAP